MGGQFASGTDVGVDRSRVEIEKMLHRFGAEQFGYVAGRDGRVAIEFLLNERRIRFVLTLPSVDDKQFKTTPSGRQRKGGQAAIEKEWEQACRQKWRALMLSIKGKLVACDDEISTFEDEFMAHTILPNGQTVAEVMKPQIAEAYQTRRMPPGILAALPAPD